MLTPVRSAPTDFFQPLQGPGPPPLRQLLPEFCGVLCGAGCGDCPGPPGRDESPPSSDAAAPSPQVLFGDAIHGGLKFKVISPQNVGKWT